MEIDNVYIQCQVCHLPPLRNYSRNASGGGNITVYFADLFDVNFNRIPVFIDFTPESQPYLSASPSRRSSVVVDINVDSTAGIFEHVEIVRDAFNDIAAQVTRCRHAGDFALSTVVTLPFGPWNPPA